MITPKRIRPENNCFFGSLEISSAATSCSTSPASVISCLGKQMFTNKHHENDSSDSQRNTNPCKFKETKWFNHQILINVPLTMIFGGVPTIVMIPPISAANANGINWRDAGILATAQIPTTTGK